MTSNALRHSSWFLAFAVLSVMISPFIMGAYPLVCLGLVSTIGIAHGALDHVKGRRLLDHFGVRSMAIFYAAYVGLALITGFLWHFQPSILIATFIGLACYHFGHEDTGPGVTQSWWTTPALALKGSMVVAAPMLFHPNETLRLFQMIHVESFPRLTVEIWLGVLCLGWVAAFALGRNSSRRLGTILHLDLAAVVLLNAALHPLLAFTLYFCFLHSVRHSLALIKEMSDDWRLGVQTFTRSGWFIALLTAAFFGIATAALASRYSVSEASVKTIFIGLAALTFPHIFLDLLAHKFGAARLRTDEATGVRALASARRESEGACGSASLFTNHVEKSIEGIPQLRGCVHRE